MTKFFRTFAAEMMYFFDIVMLSVALAMDCFAVSIVSGVMMTAWQRSKLQVILRQSVLFGLFQALMPLVGWLATSLFAHYIEAYDHWIAFGLLVFLGGRMIRSAFQPDDAGHFEPSRWLTGVTLAFATSIDALAVGISFAMTDYKSLASLLMPLVVIGIGSFLFSITGHLLGIRFGSEIRRRLQPELFGGIILIAIGVKILVTHLL